MRFFVKNGNTAMANLTNVGAGTAFSILPTYRKVAIWFRTN